MTTISSEQVRAARALIRWEQKDLADRSKLSLGSIKRLEAQPGALAAQSRTVDAIRTALEAAGVEFTNGGQPGVRMNKFLSFLGEVRAAVSLAEQGKSAEGNKLACRAYESTRQKILEFASQNAGGRELEQITLLQLGANLDNAFKPQSEPARKILAFILEKIRVDSASGSIGSQA